MSLIANQVIPEGYKQTEIGIIPEDWKVKSFGQVMSIRHGKDQKSVEVDDGQYPILGTGGKMGSTNTPIYDKPSVLIGRKGTINKPRYMDVPFWTVDTLFYSEVEKSESAKFIYYKFCMIDWMQYNEASGVPSLNARTIENVLSCFPALEEQTAIANALSDMDALLSELEKLMAKKQAIKTAVMQQLLTGKTRLPAFATHTEGALKGQPKGTKSSELGEIPEDWEVLKLEHLISFRNGAAHENCIDDAGDYIVVNSKFISTEGRVRKSSKECRQPALQSDLLMVMSDVPNGKAIAKCYLVEVDNKYTINQRICALKAENIEPKYLFYILNRNPYYLAFDDGAKQTNLRRQDVLNCPLLVPHKEEQTVITTILTDMDTEIQTLKQRLSKTRQIKQGMMQELLTGRTRLPFDKAEAQDVKVRGA